jgi:hypothetical protein
MWVTSHPVEKRTKIRNVKDHAEGGWSLILGEEIKWKKQLKNRANSYYIKELC